VTVDVRFRKSRKIFRPDRWKLDFGGGKNAAGDFRWYDLPLKSAKKGEIRVHVENRCEYAWNSFIGDILGADGTQSRCKSNN